MRVVFVAIASPFKRQSWSGIPFFALREVERRFPGTQVIETPRLDRLVERIGGLERHGLMVRRQPGLVRLYSRRIEGELERLQPDVVVAIGAAHKLAFIDRKWPLVYAADCLFASVVSYYGKYRRLSPRARAKGEAIQRELLARADRVLLASQWAVDEARIHYGLDPDVVRVAPMGANLEDDPGFQPPQRGEPLRLLFVGFDWERKGGSRIFAVWQCLRREFRDVELHVVGSEPAELDGIEGVHVHGRIDKTDPLAFARLRELYARCSFLTMLSRQEAYGLVYCEAAAFGRPSIAARTGGIETIVADGESGLLVDAAETPQGIADRIAAVWRSPARYRAMCLAARARFEQALSWRAWGQHVEAAIVELVRPAAAAEPAPPAAPSRTVPRPLFGL